MRHAEQHAKTRTQERRRALAVEAARLITESGIRDFHQAKLKAAERLGIHDDKSLPRNSEIQDALREHQRLFLPDTQPQLLRERRAAAEQAMEFFARFDPRLVGAVLEGTADEHSAVCLHLYSDELEAIPLFLAEHRIPHQQRTRTVRLDRERSIEAPVHVFAAEGTPVDITVLPRHALRQPPLDRIAERPMQRATLAVLRELILEDQLSQWQSTQGAY